MYPLIDDIILPYVATPTAVVRPECYPQQAEPIAYEVVRLYKGRRLAWDKHVTRLMHSASAVALPIPDEATLIAMVERLYQCHPLDEANVRIVLSPDALLAYYVTSYYPTPAQQAEGVVTTILDWEREDPQIKLIRADYKAAVADAFARPIHPFEVLLRDRQGRLTEGSRSNLFFIKEQTVYGPRPNEILLGTSRALLLDLLPALGLHYSEDLRPWAELQQGYGAFLTASPIDVLGIAQIDGVHLVPPSQTAIPRIAEAYRNAL